MDDLFSMGRFLVAVGILIAGIGGMFMLSGKLPWIGRLPGDIHIEGDHYSIYIPVTTSVLLSLILSFLLYLFNR